MSATLQSRIDEVRARVDFAAIVGGAGVVLGRGGKPRGKCPFHGSKSASFVVDTGKGYARCYGCPWHGDVIKFVMDFYGKPFADALSDLETGAGLDPQAAAPRRMERQPQRVKARERISSADMGRWIWRSATHRPDAVRTYLRGRRVPEAMLGDDRLGDIRFHALAPLFPWDEGAEAPPASALKAPAICALVRRPVIEDGAVRFVPIGLHVTYLAPSLERKMERAGADGEELAARKMLGESLGGCVILGPTQAHDDGRSVTIDGHVPLYAGEGIETTLSGMSIAKAPPSSIGLATLSLGNLQGDLKRWKNGVWPLFDLKPDPASRLQAVAFPHNGPVTVLVDADMKPLRGERDRQSGRFLGIPVVEARGGPIVRRAITTAERAAICADLGVKAWRTAGARRVTAVRPPMGMDFNDAVREGL